jgi:malonyl-CoA/methylmalonyl-CoA synthetase
MTFVMSESLFSLFTPAGGHAASRRSALALTFRNGPDDEEIWTYGRLFATVEDAARGLVERGVERGDRIACLAAPSPAFVVAALSALRAGAMLVPVNTAYRRREIAHILGDAAPRLLLADAAGLETIAEIPADERGGVEEMLDVGALAGSPPSPTTALPELTADDLALMLYTSGTTGRSKGAELSHGNLVAMIESLHTAWEWSASDRLLLTLPLFHLHGLVVGLLTALAAGATVLLEPRFDAARALDRLGAGEATLFFGVPTLYVRLVDELARREPLPELAAVRLFVSGSAPLAPETFHAFEALTGHRILERYGMSETGMLLSNPLAGPRIAGTVGTPLPGVEARLVDAAGRALGPGAEGEIEVRGRNVFRGYRNAPEKTAEAFRRDPAAADFGLPWFRTGDLASIDSESGHYRLLGRASELILSGGFNVYPREIEEVLLAFPGIREAAVVGESHAEFGQSPAAFLVADGELDDEALAAHCRDHLAAFKLPRRFVRVEALPRNAMGKVEKRRLPDPALL